MIDVIVFLLCYNCINSVILIECYAVNDVVDEAVNIAHKAAFVNMGQNCCAASRTFVQESIYDKFVEKSAKLASQMKVGDQFDSSTEVWPLVRFKIPCLILNEK